MLKDLLNKRRGNGAWAASPSRPKPRLDWQDVSERSSNLLRVAFEENPGDVWHGSLYVEFKPSKNRERKVYRSDNVPAHYYKAIIESRSPGSTYNKLIKGGFEGAILTGADIPS